MQPWCVSTRSWYRLYSGHSTSIRMIWRLYILQPSNAISAYSRSRLRQAENFSHKNATINKTIVRIGHLSGPRFGVLFMIFFNHHKWASCPPFRLFRYAFYGSSGLREDFTQLCSAWVLYETKFGLVSIFNFTFMATF